MIERGMPIDAVISADTGMDYGKTLDSEIIAQPIFTFIQTLKDCENAHLIRRCWEMGKTVPHVIREIAFEGPLQEPVQNFVEEKRRLGNLYNAEAYLLKELSRLAISENCPNNVLTKELVHLWTTKRPTHGATTHRSRCSVVRQLGEYMIRMGYDAYIASLSPTSKFEKKEFVPYIFSDDELCRFFAAIDTIPRGAHSPYQHLTFRMLYGCGLRLSEALMLKVKDVDLK